MASDVVYVRLTAQEKARLADVLRAKGGSQNTYAREALLAAVERDALKYARVIEQQKELEK